MGSYCIISLLLAVHMLHPLCENLFLPPHTYPNSVYKAGDAALISLEFNVSTSKKQKLNCIRICKETVSTKFKLKKNLMEGVQRIERQIGRTGSGRNQGRRGRVQILPQGSSA